MPIDSFHPVVASWFRDRFGQPTEAQKRGWPAIAAGKNTLIAAPTGSGKTLAAFLACLDQLIVRRLRQPLPGIAQGLSPPPAESRRPGRRYRP